MKFSETQGDLFTVSTDYALAHCISVDCALGAGIAAQFSSRYPQLRASLRAQKPQVGQALAYQSNDYLVFNLITKQLAWGKPTYATLQQSLESLRDELTAAKCTLLAMPRIGSGLDRLAWARVRTLIQEVFATTDIDIRIYYL